MSIFSRLFKPNLDGEGIGEGIGEGVSGDVAYFAVGKQAANSQSSLDDLPGTGGGETPVGFAAGKQAANSQDGGSQSIPSGNANVHTDTDEVLDEGGGTPQNAGTNQQGAVQQQSAYLADWSKGFNNVMFGTPATEGQAAVPGIGKNIPITQAIADYNKWAKENNGEALDAFTLYPMLSKYDASKSIADNEKAEKRLKRQQTWEQIGGVLSHVGNLVGTIMGAPSQQLESGTTLTERQRKLRDYTVQQRQQQAGDLLKLYYQDMADKRAAELNQANIAYKGAQTTYMGNKDAREKELNDANIALRQAQQGLNEARQQTEDALREGKVNLQESQIERNHAGAAASRASATASRARARQINQQTDEDYTDRYEQYR